MGGVGNFGMNEVAFGGSPKATELSTTDSSNVDIKALKETVFGENYPHEVKFYGTIYSH